MTPKELAALDQSRPILIEHMALMAKGLHEKFKAEGFTEVQAFELVRVWMFAAAGGKIER